MNERRFDTTEIKQRVDIVELAGELVPLKRMGKDYFGKCPFHSEKDASFSVSPSKQMFHCFGCGAGGDVIAFWMKFHQVSFGQAVVAIAGRYHIALPDQPFDQAAPRTPRTPAPKPWQPKEPQAPADLWREHAGKFVHWCYEQLYEHPEAHQYLLSRGITDTTIAAFPLGWNPGRNGKTVFRDRESWGVPKETNEKTGRPRPLALPVGWVIPWFTAGGTLCRVRIRRPDPLPEGMARYYIVPGSSSATMVIPAKKGMGFDHRRIYVVIEAELDTILLSQEAGDIAGGVGLGSAQTKPDEPTTALLRDAAVVLNALDFDAAGAKARFWWEREFPDAERWPAPKGKDPGEAFLAGVNIREWVIAGLPEGLRRICKGGNWNVRTSGS